MGYDDWLRNQYQIKSKTNYGWLRQDVTCLLPPALARVVGIKPSFLNHSMLSSDPLGDISAHQWHGRPCPVSQVSTHQQQLLTRAVATFPTRNWSTIPGQRKLQAAKIPFFGLAKGCWWQPCHSRLFQLAPAALQPAGKQRQWTHRIPNWHWLGLVPIGNLIPWQLCNAHVASVAPTFATANPSKKNDDYS